MPTVKVTLDQTTAPWTVQVDKDPIKIPRNANPQSIHWHLSGNAYAGEFRPLGGAKPGFAWAGAKPTGGIFDGPTLSAKKKAVTLKDHHTAASSKGDWPYALCVVLDGVTYQTGPLTIAGQNPIIRNN
jgi:hypothetical protein